MADNLKFCKFPTAKKNIIIIHDIFHVRFSAEARLAVDFLFKNEFINAFFQIHKFRVDMLAQTKSRLVFAFLGSLLISFLKLLMVIDMKKLLCYRETWQKFEIISAIRDNDSEQVKIRKGSQPAKIFKISRNSSINRTVQKLQTCTRETITYLCKLCKMGICSGIRKKIFWRCKSAVTIAVFDEIYNDSIKF